MTKLLSFLISLALLGCSFSTNIAGGTDIELGGNYIVGTAVFPHKVATAEAVLVPDGYVPELSSDSIFVSTIDSTGIFRFDSVPYGEYNLILRDSSSDYSSIIAISSGSFQDTLEVDSVIVQQAGKLSIPRSLLPDSGTIVLAGTDISVSFQLGSEDLIISGIPQMVCDSVMVLTPDIATLLSENIQIYSGITHTIRSGNTLLFVSNNSPNDQFLRDSIFSGILDSIVTIAPSLISASDLLPNRVVCIASDVSTLSDTGMIQESSLPIIVIGDAFSLALGISQAGGDTTTNESWGISLNESSPILTGVNIIGGKVELAEPGDTLFASSGSVYADVIVSTIYSDQTSLLYTYEPGDTLASSETAQGKRVYLFETNSPITLTNSGRILYRRTLLWSAGLL